VREHDSHVGHRPEAVDGATQVGHGRSREK
jgi:hypothetical protein